MSRLPNVGNYFWFGLFLNQCAVWTKHGCKLDESWGLPVHDDSQSNLQPKLQHHCPPHYFILFQRASQKSYIYLTCLSSAFLSSSTSHKNRSSLGIKNLVCVCVCVCVCVWDYRPIFKNSTRYIQNSNCTTGVEWMNGHILISILSLEGWISLLGHRVMRRVKSISSSPRGNHSFSGRSLAGLALTIYIK